MADIETPRLNIGPSNLDIPPKDLLLFDAADYREFAEAGGYDAAAGFEITPLRFHYAQRAAEDLAWDGDTIVLHESWREGGIADIFRSGTLGGAAVEASVIAAFPMLDKSYKRLTRIQDEARAGSVARKEAPRNLAIIVHPDGQHLDNQLPARPRQSFPRGAFGKVLFQPTAEWAHAAGLNVGMGNAEALAGLIGAVANDQGLDGVALDLHHLRTERAGRRFRDPVALAGALAARHSLHEVQLSLRPEFSGDEAEVRQVCRGELGQTVFGEMLTAINESVPSGTIRMVVEAQPGIVTGLSDGQTLHQVHRTITDSLRQHMPQA